MRLSLCAALPVLVVTILPAWADPVLLQCRGYSTTTHDLHEFGVALDTDARQVLDFGHGDGVETTDFTETTIAARMDPCAHGEHASDRE